MLRPVWTADLHFGCRHVCALANDEFGPNVRIVCASLCGSDFSTIVSVAAAAAAAKRLQTNGIESEAN